MFIIIDTVTNKIKQTINENYGLHVSETEKLQEIKDEVLRNKIDSAYDYTLIFDQKGDVQDVTVIKTIEQYQQEQLLNPTIIAEQVDAEKVAIAEAIVNLTLEVETLKQQLNGGTV